MLNSQTKKIKNNKVSSYRLFLDLCDGVYKGEYFRHILESLCTAYQFPAGKGENKLITALSSRLKLFTQEYINVEAITKTIEPLPDGLLSPL